MSHDWSALLDQVTHRMEMTYHPTIGHLHVPNHVVRLPHERGGYYSRTNAHGFRSDVEFVDKRGVRPRILFFGDSFTAGQGCDNHERYSEVLGGKLGADVYNYAVSGTAPDQQLLIYEELAADVEADLIVWGLALHNIERMQMTHRPSRDRITGQAILMPKPYFTLESEELHLHHVPVPRVRPELTAGEERGYLDEQVDTGLSFVRAAKGVLRVLGAQAQPMKHRARGFMYRATDVQMYDDYRDANSDGWRMLAALIRRFKTSCRDIPLMVVPLPTYHYYVDRLEPIYDHLFESLEDSEPGLHVLSLTRDLVKGKSLSQRLAYCFEHDSHYSPHGHDTLAAIMAREIRRREILPPVSSSTVPKPHVDPVTQDVLGVLTADYGASAVLRDGRVVASANERPFWRTEQRSDFPSRSTNYCIEEARIQQPDLAACVYVGSASVEHPRESGVSQKADVAWCESSAPEALTSVPASHPLRAALSYSGQALVVSHGYAQCASAFYASPFEDAAVLSIHESIDGTVASIAVGSGRTLRVVAELRAGIGLEVAAAHVARAVGLSGEDALFELGVLAGQPQPDDVRAVRAVVFQFGDGGSFAGLDIDETRVRAALGLSASDLTETRRGEVAGAFLSVVRECVVEMAKHARRLTVREELCVVGAAFHSPGVCEAVKAHGAAQSLYREQRSGAVSAAIGAAALGWHMHMGGQRHPDHASVPSVGPAFSSDEIQAFLYTHDFPYHVLPDTKVEDTVAELCSTGQRVGYFAGRMSGGAAGNARAVLLGAGEVEGERRLIAFGGQLRAVRRRLESVPGGGDGGVMTAGVPWVPLQLAGEGVALTPFDAYRCMMLGGLDSLVLENYLVRRAEQPLWPDQSAARATDHIREPQDEA